MTFHRSAPCLQEFLRDLRSDSGLREDFDAICDFGGRLAGTPGEQDAAQWAAARLGMLPGSLVVTSDLFRVWEQVAVSLTSLRSGETLACTPLLGTASTLPEGLTAEVVDLGLGRPSDFAREQDSLPGRIAMVRHEYPFMHDHVHRDVKVRLAEESGAVAFLIAFPEIDVGPVSGSGGQTGKGGIPSLGISAEAAACLTEGAAGRALARIVCCGRDIEAPLSTIVLTLHGESDETIVVSAHVDGHPLGESAIDNASGMAAAIALARATAALTMRRRTVQFCLFSAEEWDLGGSRRWLDGLTEEERRRIALNINLDAVAGDDGFTALTSDFAGLPAFLQDAVRDTGLSLGIFEPLKDNSDHANFAGVGIPAFRLLAGFGRPKSALRYLLTPKDQRDLVTTEQLGTATAIAGAILLRALHASSEELAGLRARRIGA